MKKLIITSLVLIFIFSCLTCQAENKLKDLKTLLIYIGSKEYTGEKFLGEDGNLYVSLDELISDTSLEFSCLEKETELIINGVSFPCLKKNNKNYVVLTALCQHIGYLVSYTEKTNILEISKPRLNSNPGFQTSIGNSTGLILGEWKFTPGEYTSSVDGIVTNNSDEVISYASIRFNIYDKDGNQIGDALDGISNLQPHSNWKFHAGSLEGKGAVTATFVELSGH